MAAAAVAIPDELPTPDPLQNPWRSSDEQITRNFLARMEAEHRKKSTEPPPNPEPVKRPGTYWKTQGTLPAYIAPQTAPAEEESPSSEPPRPYDRMPMNDLRTYAEGAGATADNALNLEDDELVDLLVRKRTRRKKQKKQELKQKYPAAQQPASESDEEESDNPSAAQASTAADMEQKKKA